MNRLKYPQKFLVVGLILVIPLSIILWQYTAQTDLVIDDVTTAIDGEVALRQLRERDFDLVVSDVQMPNMDGFALTRFLRESVDYADLPIILVTSLESVEDRERGLHSGANAYIVKRGFDQAELLSTIRQLI